MNSVRDHYSPKNSLLNITSGEFKEYVNKKFDSSYDVIEDEYGQIDYMTNGYDMPSDYSTPNIYNMPKDRRNSNNDRKMQAKIDKMAEDIHTIKNIMVFYLTVSIISGLIIGITLLKIVNK